MDNAQKAIMIGVGLFITIIIISAVLLIVNLGTGLMNDASSELGAISGVLRSQVLDNYAGKTKTGSEMLAAIRQYSNSDAVSMIIYNTTTVTGTPYYVGAGKLTLPSGTTADDFGTTAINDGSVAEPTASDTMDTYSTISANIPSQKYYATTVVYDTEGNVIGIAAIQK